METFNFNNDPTGLDEVQARLRKARGGLDNGYYLVTAVPPTSVACSLAISFTHPKSHELVVARSTQLSFHSVSEHGKLALISQIDLFGRVATMELIQPQESEVDLLLVVTEKRQFFVLGWEGGRILTKSSGSFLADLSGEHGLDQPVICKMDRIGRVAFLFLNVGLIKVLPLVSSKQHAERLNNTRQLSKSQLDSKLRPFELGDALPAKEYLFELLQILDVLVLPVSHADRVTVAVLHASTPHHRCLAYYQYNCQLQDLVRLDELDVENFGPCHHLLPLLPGTGLLGLGERGLAVHAPFTKDPKLVRFRLGKLADHSIRCITPVVEYHHYLGATADGSIFSLRLIYSSSNQLLMRIEVEIYKGSNVGSPNSLTWLGDDNVFLGAHYGASQVLKTASDHQLCVLTTCPGISPILDVAKVRYSDLGLDKLLVCSYDNSDSSGKLHQLTNGVPFRSDYEVALPSGLSGLWWMGSGIVALSFLNQTRMVQFDLENSSLNHINEPNLIVDQPSLLIANLQETGQLVQVTPNQVTLLASGLKWVPPTGQHITLADHNQQTIGLVINGTQLVFLSAVSLHLLHQIDLGREVAVLSLFNSFCGLGFWLSSDVVILNIADSSYPVVCTTNLPDGIIPRSMVLTNCNRLLVGMVDGSVFFYHVTESGSLTHGDAISPSTQPLTLVPLSSNGTSVGLSLGTDQCALIYPYLDTLSFTPIHGLRGVRMGCLVDQELILLAKEDRLVLGRLVQTNSPHEAQLDSNVKIMTKLQLTSFDYECSPHRLCSLEDGRLLVLSDRQIRLLNEQMQPMSIAFSGFDVGESPLSIGCNGQWVVVGTGHAPLPGAELPNQGRLLVFDNQLKLIDDLSVSGAVQSIKIDSMGAIFISVNSKLVQYIIRDSKLQEVASLTGNLHIVALDELDGLVLVGDLMRSVRLVQMADYNSKKQAGQLIEVAKDWANRWVTAVHILDPVTFLVADASNNLLVLKRDLNRIELRVLYRYHLGDQVNCITSANLAPPPHLASATDSQRMLATAANQTTAQSKEGTFQLQDIPFQPIVLGTLSGRVSILNPIPRATLNLLLHVQRNLLQYLGTSGNLSHTEYRAYWDSATLQPPSGFVDGDVLQLFLQLPYPAQLEVLSGNFHAQPSMTHHKLTAVTSLSSSSSDHGLALSFPRPRSLWDQLRAFPHSLDSEMFLTSQSPNEEDSIPVEVDSDGKRIKDPAIDGHIPVSHTALVTLLMDLARLH